MLAPKIITRIYCFSLNTLSFFEFLKLLRFCFVCLLPFIAVLGSREIFVLTKTQSPLRKLNLDRTSLPMTCSTNRNL